MSDGPCQEEPTRACEDALAIRLVDCRAELQKATFTATSAAAWSPALPPTQSSVDGLPLVGIIAGIVLVLAAGVAGFSIGAATYGRD